MLKPLNNGKVFVSVSFRQQISSVSKRKMPKVDLEIVEKFEVFVVLNAVSVQFPRVIVINSIAFENERTSYALHFLKRKLQRFSSKTFQQFLLSTSSFLSNLCFLLNRFGFRTMANAQQRLNAYFSRPSKK